MHTLSTQRGIHDHRPAPLSLPVGLESAYGEFRGSAQGPSFNGVVRSVIDHGESFAASQLLFASAGRRDNLFFTCDLRLPCSLTPVVLAYTSNSTKFPLKDCVVSWLSIDTGSSTATFPAYVIDAGVGQVQSGCGEGGSESVYGCQGARRGLWLCSHFRRNRRIPKLNRPRNED